LAVTKGRTLKSVRPFAVFWVGKKLKPATTAKRKSFFSECLGKLFSEKLGEKK
jgi:hypothetical protein